MEISWRSPERQHLLSKKMNPILDREFLSELKSSYIAIDACCLIDGIKYPESVGKFLLNISRDNCSFYTVPIVVYEYLRGAGTQKDLASRRDYLKTITDGTVLPIDRQFNLMTDFLLIMNKTAKCDLGEYQLIASIVGFGDRYLLTENDKHIPKEFIDRVSVVTFNLESEIKNYCFYKFNSDKYERIAQNILTSQMRSE